MMGLGILLAIGTIVLAAYVFHTRRQAIRAEARQLELERLNEELALERLRIEADLLDLRTDMPPWVDATTEEVPRAWRTH